MVSVCQMDRDSQRWRLQHEVRQALFDTVRSAFSIECTDGFLNNEITIRIIGDKMKALDMIFS